MMQDEGIIIILLINTKRILHIHNVKLTQDKELWKTEGYSRKGIQRNREQMSH